MNTRNFQHLDAIGELRKAIALQKNLPHAYNRLGTILAHIGLLDRAWEMFERGRPFQPKNAVNHSIVQVYPNCAENPVLEVGDAERGERSSP